MNEGNAASAQTQRRGRLRLLCQVCCEVECTEVWGHLDENWELGLGVAVSSAESSVEEALEEVSREDSLDDSSKGCAAVAGCPSSCVVLGDTGGGLSGVSLLALRQDVSVEEAPEDSSMGCSSVAGCIQGEDRAAMPCDEGAVPSR